MKNKSQTPYFTEYSLLTDQDLQQPPYQILFIILLKEFIKLNANMDIMKNVKHKKLNTKLVFVFLNTQMLKMV